MPENPTASRIVIDVVELVNPKGLDIIGITLSDPDVDGGIGTAEGFPPQGLHAMNASGAVLAPAGDTPSHLQVLVGVRLGGSSEGSIDGLRIRYRYNGATYEVILHYGLRVVGKPT